RELQDLLAHRPIRGGRGGEGDLQPSPHAVDDLDGVLSALAEERHREPRRGQSRFWPSRVGFGGWPEQPEAEATIAAADVHAPALDGEGRAGLECRNSRLPRV